MAILTGTPFSSYSANFQPGLWVSRLSYLTKIPIALIFLNIIKQLDDSLLKIGRLEVHGLFAQGISSGYFHRVLLQIPCPDGDPHWDPFQFILGKFPAGLVGVAFIIFDQNPHRSYLLEYHQATGLFSPQDWSFGGPRSLCSGYLFWLFPPCSSPNPLPRWRSSLGPLSVHTRQISSRACGCRVYHI